MPTKYFSIKEENFNGKTCGIGDVIFIMYCLENLGKQKNINFKLKVEGEKVCEICKKLNKHFEFKKVSINEKLNIFTINSVDLIKEINNYSLKNKCNCKIGMYNGCFFISQFSKFLIENFNFDIKKSNPIKQKLKTNRKKELTLVQFDKRGVKKNYSEKEIKEILKYKNYFYIGGKESKEYYIKIYTKIEESKYLLGDLSYLIEKMNRCKEFIGADSGMSHLAGIIGIKSTVYMKNDSGRCLSSVYKCYPKTKTKNSIYFI